MINNRDNSVDALRGFACILLVSYHVIGSNYTNGLRITDGIYRELNDILIFIRMPLFTFLSGYIYARRAYSSNVKGYISGKFNRLLVPMIVVGSMFAFLQYIVPGSNQSIQNWYLLHIIPVGHFWFIEAIFLIFMLMIPLEKYKILSNGFSFIIVFVLSCLLYLSNIEIQYFSISGFIYLLPFFLLGLAVKRFNLILLLTTKIKVTVSVLLVLLLINIFIGVITVEPHRTILSLLLGGLSCYILLSFKWQSRYLAIIGTFSYTIYLFHVFFNAFSRIVFSKIGVTDINILFLLSLLAGIFGPILVEKIFSQYTFTRIALLGKKPLKRKNDT